MTLTSQTILRNKQNILSPEVQKQISDILAKYPKGQEKAAMREILSYVLSPSMNEKDVQEIIKSIAFLYGISIRFLMETVRNELGYERNKSEYKIQICGSLPCLLRGGGEIVKTCEKWLGIACETKTIDSRFLLKKRTCLNQCTVGPIIEINGQQQTDMTPTKMISLLQDLTSDEKSGRSLKQSTLAHNPYIYPNKKDTE